MFLLNLVQPFHRSFLVSIKVVRILFIGLHLRTLPLCPGGPEQVEEKHVLSLGDVERFLR